MTRRRFHSTRIDPYGYDLHAAYTDNQWAAAVRAFGVPDDPGAAGRTDTLTWEPHDLSAPAALVWVVWIDSTKLADPATRVNTIAHEATHVAAALHDHIGDTNTTGEPFAYLVGWITGWLWGNYPDEETT